MHYFTGKRVLLLQGPIGPFFYRLNKDLTNAGATVFKINFNAGDWIFYPRGGDSYKASLTEWPSWFSDYIKKQSIDTVILFGDCRPIHYSVRDIIIDSGVELSVFEEGYWRPNHITFEQFGVNDHSLLENSARFYLDFNNNNNNNKYEVVDATYWPMMTYGFLYALMFNLGRPLYREYQHHRNIGFLQCLPWIRSFFRSFLYRFTERGMEQKLIEDYQGKFFLVPLQVEDDYQISFHSDINSMSEFIELTMKSFARHAPLEAVLVFKHHSMDRGHRNYQKLIQDLAGKYFMNDRVFYIHDQNLPRLLDASRGVVVVNSTVGLSALIHHKPVKALGRAIYNFEGLTYQGNLDDFWKIASSHQPSEKLVQNFLGFLVKKTQVNGSFYKRLKSAKNHTGLKWNSPRA